ncbi:MAG: hypothetical protein HY909_04570 [Deltaproteobacteria bacterium]|nr:hypothetical protein [Deltaproteobacteria bacterium]
MGTERTAWHYFLGVLLRERCPSWAEVEVEVPLTREVQRLDYLLLRRRRRGNLKDRGGTLQDLWPLLPRETLAEFKSASKGYRERGLHKLLGYGFQYFSEGPHLPTAEDLCLVLLLGERNATLDRDLAALSLKETPLAPGITHAGPTPIRLLVVDFGAVTRAWPEDPVSLYAPGAPVTDDVSRWWYDHFGRTGNDTVKPQELQEYRLLLKRFLDTLPPEQRLEGLAPEDRLKGLGPEERLKGLAPEHRLTGLRPEERLAGLSLAEQLLALPPELLALLPESVIAQQSPEVQASLRARRGH